MVDGEKLKTMVMEHYLDLFRVDGAAGGKFLKGAFPSIGDEVCEELIKECTVEEIKLALRGVGLYKVPGLDGNQASFFKSTWNLADTEVYSFVKGVLEGGDVSEEATGALLVLIPKEANLYSMRGFRPLSL